MALRDLNPFARRPEPHPSFDRALAELDRLAGERPELTVTAGSVGRVLEAAFRRPAPEIPLHASPDLLREAWAAGVPAFRAGETPPTLDAADLRARALAVCLVLAETDPRAGELHRAIKGGEVDVSAWAVRVVAEGLDGFDPGGFDESLASSVLKLAMLPSLCGLSARLAAERPSGLWTHGSCPNCGGAPTIAETRGLEQRRYWRCDLCAADWEGERLRCPFCGETDHHKLHYRYLDGQLERCRLDLCDSCGGRLKVVSTLAAITPPGLLVAELATAHLDGL